MRPSKFFVKQERIVTFTPVSNPDEWNSTRGVPFSASGIVAIGSQTVDPLKETAPSSSSVRMFFKISEKVKLSEVKIGTIAKVDGVSYSVTKIDLRGVIAGSYPLRLEGVRK